MSKTERGQVNSSAAEIYEEFFVPALFREWAARVCESAGIEQGQKVLDVACGTGVLARSASRITGPDGSVVGLDLNEGMLEVANQKAAGVDWKQGAAESIPFENETFDAVISQFGLMFFADKTTALKEMFRVLKSGGTLTIAVWDSLESAVGYKTVVGLLNRLFGDEIADALRSPYSLGNIPILESLFESAGISGAEIIRHDGTARFPSIESWMFTDVKGWTLADLIDEKQYQHLLNEAERVLQPFVLSSGKVEFEHPAYIISVVKP
jgi:ubiquinone/menaquinone biosynthesis C-methylase UbiE